LILIKLQIVIVKHAVTASHAKTEEEIFILLRIINANQGVHTAFSMQYNLIRFG
jgi:hypothetical protein